MDLNKQITRSEIAIVLAMHGTPPKDFPKKELKEFFELRAALKHETKPIHSMKIQYAALDSKIRKWPRTDKNDPFFLGSQALGQDLEKVTGFQVIVGFNEFCDPGLEEAIRKSLKSATKKVIVTTPMMTRGGLHSEKDIPSAIQNVQKTCPQTSIVYAWPFASLEVATFLNRQITKTLHDD
ncbi:MAG: sirohydrochlorin chelatase [Nitrospiria bacterium]